MYVVVWLQPHLVFASTSRSRMIQVAKYRRVFPIPTFPNLTSSLAKSLGRAFPQPDLFSHCLLSETASRVALPGTIFCSPATRIRSRRVRSSCVQPASLANARPLADPPLAASPSPLETSKVTMPQEATVVVHGLLRHRRGKRSSCTRSLWTPVHRSGPFLDAGLCNFLGSPVVSMKYC